MEGDHSRSYLPVESIEPYPGGSCITSKPSPSQGHQFLKNARGWLDTQRCLECASVWLSNPRFGGEQTLCPCCNPQHAGYIADRSFVARRQAEMLPRWRNELLELLELRAAGATAVQIELYAAEMSVRLMFGRFT